MLPVTLFSINKLNALFISIWEYNYRSIKRFILVKVNFE